jgi:hypothetical protein
MICVIEIGLFIFGIMMLITGKMKLSAGRVVEGTPARLLGLLALVPLPLALVVGAIYTATVVMQGPNPGAFDLGNRDTIIITVIEAVITLGTLAAVLGIGYAVGKAPVDKRQRLVEEWEDEEDELPRRGTAAARDEDDDADDRPRRRVSREDEEDRKQGRYRE